MLFLVVPTAIAQIVKLQRKPKVCTALVGHLPFSLMILFIFDNIIAVWVHSAQQTVYKINVIEPPN